MELLTFLSTNINNLYSQKKKFLVSDAVSDYIRSPFDLTKKFISSYAVSDLTHKLSDQIKKFMVSGAVSDCRRSPIDLIKKFMASGAVSDFNYKLSDLIKKFLASETVVYVLQWFKKESVPIIVAVVVIALLFRICRGGAASSVKTMKAPGRNFRIPRSNFEASPSAYFRDLRKG
ncbi:PREDICTED: uncharacterized protein LOC105137668 isoform X2 [Populus euphratica]|uniref:Uncharacterized protein LOC105137668 isoform X2 n=1 Tax=Populus euphratica TaxID=75702 RepID=A0AAJ6V759_POPEU|nr:PREDICTED: uncharacterized protein LOC105137668 isoform X2 [Populus euphratica]